jgi:hypothetical protein
VTLDYSAGLRISNNVLYGPGSCKDKIIRVPEGITEVKYGSEGSYYSSRYPDATAIILPESTKIIGSDAFYSSNIIAIHIPNTVTSIGEGAFERCKNLQYLIFPDNLSRIDHSVAYSCPNLESIVIPKTVTYISARAFSEYGYDLYYKGSITDWLKKINMGTSYYNPLTYAKNFYIADSYGNVEYDNVKYTPIYDFILPADATSSYENFRP